MNGHVLPARHALCRVHHEKTLPEDPSDRLPAGTYTRHPTPRPPQSILSTSERRALLTNRDSDWSTLVRSVSDRSHRRDPLLTHPPQPSPSIMRGRKPTSLFNLCDLSHKSVTTQEKTPTTTRVSRTARMPPNRHFPPEASG